jgi:hypothetical protein
LQAFGRILSVLGLFLQADTRFSKQITNKDQTNNKQTKAVYTVAKAAVGVVSVGSAS